VITTAPAVPGQPSRRGKTRQIPVSRRKPAIAGGLLTVGSLLGMYLGYIRPSGIYAAGTCPVGSTTFSESAGVPYINGVPVGSPGEIGRVPNALDSAIRQVGNGGTVCITSDITIDNDVDVNTSVTLVGDDSVNRRTISITTGNTFYTYIDNKEVDFYVQDLDVTITRDGTPFITQYDYDPSGASSTTFTNVSVTGGGGIVEMSGGGDLTLSNVDISSFSSMAIDVYNVGNIRIDSQSDIHDGDDGATSLSILFCDGFYMIDSTISNTDDSHAWVRLRPGKNATFKDSSFTGHTISDTGVAIMDGSVTMDNFTFTDNQRIGSRRDLSLATPLINMYNVTDVTVIDSTFARNTSVYDNRDDLMYVELSGTFTASGQTSFSNNGTSGKVVKNALYVKNTGSDSVNISDAAFADNYVGQSSVYLEFPTPNALSGFIQSSSFADNVDGTYSDLSLKAPSSTFTINNSAFSSRTAPNSTVNANALASLGTGNTFADEGVPGVAISVDFRYGGATGGDSVTSAVVTTGDSADAVLPKPTQSGMHFTGWFSTRSLLEGRRITTIQGDDSGTLIAGFIPAELAQTLGIPAIP